MSYESNYNLVQRIQNETNIVGESFIRKSLVDTQPKVKPSVIELVAWDQPALKEVKKLLSNYYGSFFDVNEPTPQDLQQILDKVQRTLRYAPTQPMYFKETQGILQFAMYWPWGVCPNEYRATIVFVEVPKKWDDSKSLVAAGIGGKLARAGYLS